MRTESELCKPPSADAEIKRSAETVPRIILPHGTRVAVEMRPGDDELGSNKKLATPEWFEGFALDSWVIAEVIRGEKACFVSILRDRDRR